ncbi:MAG: FimV/HubP family polar landmark protein [Gallionella sp.]
MHKSLVKRFAIPLERRTPSANWLVILKLFGIAAALVLSASASAVGLGSINVTSALGEILKADIELVDISKTDKDNLAVRLASPDAYKNSGLEYPYGNKFKFEIQSRADGQPYIKVSSAQPVNDPFVSLLVQLTWPAGQLAREYTFLLDPPGYVPAQPAPAQVQAVPPVVQAPEAAASAVPAVSEVSPTMPVQQVASAIVAKPVQQAASAVTATPAEQTAKEVPAKQGEQAAAQTKVMPAEKAAVLNVAELPKNKEWLEVQRGDTMYEIAEKYKLADMNLDRMLVALYRANANKFDGKNMNRIRAGKILRLPTQDEYASVTQAQAVKEIHAQAADWNAYRQKLASAAPLGTQPTEAPEQVATGKISSSIADMAPVAKESAKEVLKLSKGEAPGDVVKAGPGKQALSEQEQKNAAQDDAIAREKTLKESQARAALLEKNLQDAKRLAQLKVETAALAQPPAAANAAASTPAAASAVKHVVAKPTPVAKPKAQPPMTEPSLLDQLLDEPLYLAGGAAALLGIGALGFLFLRKKKSSNRFAEKFPEDISEITGRMATPVFPSPDTGDFTVAAATNQVAETPQSDIVDPISEADLFLNFGRDAQAEEILKDALQNAPDNPQILLKLLGIYANRKDANSFSMFARKLQDSGDDAAWQQAVAMGRKLDLNNPMYGGGGGGGFRSMEDTGSATVQVTAFNPAAVPEKAPAQASALDFDFDLGAPPAQSGSSPEQSFLNDEVPTTIMSDMDFDITSDKTLSPTGAGLRSSSSGLDFDITSTNPSMPAASEPEIALAHAFSDDLVFETAGITSSFKQEAAKPETTKTEPSEDAGMAFTLDFPVEAPTEKAASPVKPVAGNFADISLNFDDIEPPAASGAESKNDNWQDVATKLDLAKAYQEMGDASGAREILEEVMQEGDAEQRESAQALLEQLG